MPLYTREQLPELLARAATSPSQVYLFFGERYLCRHAAEQLEQVLLQKTGGTINSIDGDQEQPSTTLAKLRGYSLLPGRQIYRVVDTRLFHSKQVAKNIWNRALKAQAGGNSDLTARALRAFCESGGLTSANADLALLSAEEWEHCFAFPKPESDLSWTQPLLTQNASMAEASAGSDGADALIKVLQTGLPANNILLLLAEEADKRKKLFKLLKDEQSIIDFTIEAGASSRAKNAQKSALEDIIRQTLAEQGKSLAPRLDDLLLERVGFHPVAVVMELRKVMTYIGERKQITREDLDLLVGRTREEALFELTSAISDGNLAGALLLTQRFQENGIHPLAVIATLRKFIHTQLVLRSLLLRPEIGFQPAMPAQVFQNTILPRLKEHQTWKKELGIHPYALYNQCKAAATCSLDTLCMWMRQLLQAEMRLKGSSIADDTIMQHLLVSMLTRTTTKQSLAC